MQHVDVAGTGPAHGVKMARNRDIGKLARVNAAQRLRILRRRQPELGAGEFKKPRFFPDVFPELRRRGNPTDERRGAELCNNVRLRNCRHRRGDAEKYCYRCAHDIHGESSFCNLVVAEHTPVQARAAGNCGGWVLVPTGGHKPSDAVPNVLYLLDAPRATLTTLDGRDETFPPGRYPGEDERR